jgi:hypothetical protein
MKAPANILSDIRCMLASVLLISTLALAGQTPVTREYQLKAVFLFNFTQFVEWPASSFSTDQSPLVIGILGKDPFGAALPEIVSGEKVNGHTVTVQYYNNTEEIKTCHILFINLAEPKKMERVVESLKGRNILTVSDAPDFSEQGGMVRFFIRDNKIKFQINLEASKAASLVLSSKLLKLADIYVPPKNS